MTFFAQENRLFATINYETMKAHRPALSISTESSGDIFPPKDGDIEEFRNCAQDYVVGIIQHESLDENFIRHYVQKLQPLIDAKQRVVILDLCILQMLRGASDAVLFNLWRRLKEQGRELRLAGRKRQC